MKNVLEYFEETTKKFPNKVGFTDSGRKSTFSETMQNAKSIASSLTTFGTKKPLQL